MNVETADSRIAGALERAPAASEAFRGERLALSTAHPRDNIFASGQEAYCISAALAGGKMIVRAAEDDPVGCWSERCGESPVERGHVGDLSPRAHCSQQFIEIQCDWASPQLAQTIRVRHKYPSDTL